MPADYICCLSYAGHQLSVMLSQALIPESISPTLSDCADMHTGRGLQCERYVQSAGVSECSPWDSQVHGNDT